MQRGADAKPGMDPGMGRALVLGIERPVLFLETRSTKSQESRVVVTIRKVPKGSVSSCHASTGNI